MMTYKEALWKRYYEAIRRGRKDEASMLLKQIHANPQLKLQTRKCIRCSKKF